MSLLNCFLTRDAAHVFSDGTLLSSDGMTVAGLGSKVLALPQYQAVVSAVGVAWITPLLAAAISETNHADLDDLAAGFGELVQRCVERTRQMPNAQWGKFIAGLAGWSPQQGTPLFVSTASFHREVIAFEPLRSTRFIQPAQANPYDRDILNMKFDPADPEGSGLEIVRAQRARRFTSLFDGTTCHGIGGFCQYTRITEHDITTRVLERWDDAIGSPIMPRNGRPAQPGAWL